MSSSVTKDQSKLKMVKQQRSNMDRSKSKMTEQPKQSQSRQTIKLFKKARGQSL